jgi:hypothetical protein
MKNALEGVIMDSVLSSALALSAKSLKLFRAGDAQGANAAASEADSLFAKAADEDYQAKRFFDHDQLVAQRAEAKAMAGATADERASAEYYKASVADDQAGRTKNFLNAPTEPPVPESVANVPREPLSGPAAALDREIRSGDNASTDLPEAMDAPAPWHPGRRTCGSP